MANLLKIKGLLKENKMSLRKLAADVGITEQGLQKLIRENSTKVDTLEAIARIFKVPVSYFFDNESPTNGNAATVKGDNNLLIGGDNHGTINKLSRCEQNVELLKMQVEHLKSHLAEKEKQILDKERIIELLSHK